MLNAQMYTFAAKLFNTKLCTHIKHTPEMTHS